MVTMAANNAEASGLRHDILLALLSAYKKSPGICALAQHLVFCHNREKHGAQKIRLTANSQPCRWQRLRSDWSGTRRRMRLYCCCKAE